MPENTADKKEVDFNNIAKVANVVDYIPDGFSIVSATESTVNSKYNWTVGETTNGYTEVSTNYLANTTIPAFDKDNLSISYAILQISKMPV